MLFDDYEKNLTLDKARAEFTEEEMKLLQEAGRHISVSQSYFNFGDELPESIMEKLKSLFSDWLDTVGRMEDVNGLIVETMNIIPQERDSRKEFPDFFVIYSPDEKTNGETLEEQYSNHGKYDCTGLFLKFLRGLGVEIKCGNASQKTAPLTIAYGKNTGISIITEEKRHKQIRSLSLPGQQRYELHEDGSFEIVVDNPKNELATPKKPSSENTIAKALMNKSQQGYNVGLLRLIGAGIEQAIKEGIADNAGTISIPREGLQACYDKPIRKPTQKILDFILARKAPQNKEEIELHDEIMKSYSFWVDLLNLQRAGTYQTKDGIFMIFSFEGYNEKDDTIECSSPFLRHVYEEIYSSPILGEMKNNEHSFTIYRTSPPLIRGSFYNVRNEITKEIVEAIIIMMTDRGVKSDAQLKKHYNYQNKKKVTINISYQTLIKNCPLLKRRLTEKITKKDGTEAEPDAAYKRKVLTRAIFGEKVPEAKKANMTDEIRNRQDCDSLIEAVFREHTAYYDSYVNFSVKAAPISLKALNRTGIRITHEGKSGEYQDNPTLHTPEVIL